VGRVRRSRRAAPTLGRRRALNAPVQAGTLVRLLTERFPADISELWTDEDTVEIQVPRERIVETLRTLREDPDFSFWMLADAAAVDYYPSPWFEVVYHLWSDRHPAWLRIRCRVERANPRIPTITGVWEGAMYHEREMYDMMGILFEGNRDLRRIFMSPDYKSFPQRRDFVLPDDAADSSAAGVRPLERPETWNLTQFTETFAPRLDTPQPAPATSGVEAGTTDADKSKPR
jgi:NADH-quinone oxidoreductase subunit C